ncbi:MAG: S8 family peptidase [Rhizobiaceae bacterium]
MTGNGIRKNRHLVLDGFSETERFRRPSQAMTPRPIPARDRQQHGTALRDQINAVKPAMDQAREAQQASGLEGGFGLHVEFESFPDVELAFESLARERSGIELLNVRHEDGCTQATVFVPDGKLDHFESLVQDYLDEKRDRRGHARDHRKLINAIRQIRAASLRALWTDDPLAFPATDDESFWWEVWLPIRNDRTGTVATFREMAALQELRVAPEELTFPERTVLLVHASRLQMQHSIMTLNSIAELRRAKETAEFFDALLPVEQPEWLAELIDRTRFPGSEERVPYVCLLDTGVNNGHPLIAPVLDDLDLHTVEPAWGTDDVVGHGTAMAGLTLMGNLALVLDSGEAIEVGHRIESIKLLSNDGGNTGNAQHHGYLTTEAVARPEIVAPYRPRIFGMAITARDNRDRGRPSAWSAALDKLASDMDAENDSPRLFVVSAGNVIDPNAWGEYPESNTSDGIHDPGQAWNVLTIGAYTELTHITEPDCENYTPVAESGGMSPFSTTSSTWQQHWPLKPDVVFEGGNAAKDHLGAVWMSSLSLLTSHYKPEQRVFTTANATSAATALAAQMAAKLMKLYPELWPETIRALIVHSATWTDNMMRMFLPNHGQPSKSDYANLVRHCGFGVPDIDRAMWSVSNSLTMVIEGQLHPFSREGSSQPTLRDMNLHRLPWPLEELEQLRDTQVEMHVTLSYFIEPNPSVRGFRSRYRYESHGLRFDVKRPLESDADFRARINAVARDAEEGINVGGNDTDWLIGKQNRHKGSLHSDIWRGSAADLASRGVLAIYPTVGWWKTRVKLERYNKVARYALVISIHAPEVEVDLYNAVANQIATPVVVEN